MTETENRRVAVVGASADRAKFGNKAVRAYQDEGWEVLPVNPRGGPIEDLQVARTLRELSATPDRITIYVAPERTRSLLPELVATAGPQTEVWLNPGSATPEIEEEARELGLTIRPGCSIVDIGRNPSEFP